MNKILKTIATIAISACLTCCSIMSRNTGEASVIDDGKSRSKQLSMITAGSEQLALIYNPLATTIHPTVFAKKNNLKDIDLYVTINDGELQYSKANAQLSNSASVRIYYKIMASYENTEIIDSSQTVIRFTKSDQPKNYSIKLKLKPVENDKFVVQTTVTDINRGKMSIHFTEIDKNNPYSADNFMITALGENQPYTLPYAKPASALRIDYLNSKAAYAIANGTRPLEPQITLSPYASDPAVEDSSRFYNIDSTRLSFILQFKKPGLYGTTADSNFVHNMVIPCFNSDFPNINTPEEMIKPLAYLCTPEEYSQLISSKSKKLAVDEFWYRNSHDLKKAKEQIKRYYTRAIYANLYFSDYREGVLTDRGMLYTVLGPPKMLAINSDGEVWTYRDSRNGQNIKFVFRKQRSRLCGDKYVLRRSTEYKPYWDRAVSTWRKGNVFTF